MMMLIVLAAAGVVLAADYTYARVTAARQSRWEQRQTRGADGVRAGFEPYACGTGEVAVLFVHGFGSSPRVFGPMAKELAQRGHACRIMRLPGFGEPPEAMAGVTAYTWLSAVRGELEALRPNHRQVWVAGQSMGGAISAWLLAERPDLADGLVLLAPCFDVSRRRSAQVSPRVLYEVGRHTTVFTRTLGSAFPVDARDSQVAATEDGDRFFPMEAYAAFFAVLDRAGDAAPRLQAPMLALVADRDRVADPEAARRFVARAASSRKQVVSLPVSGHVVSLDVEWRTAVDHLESFMNGTTHPSP